LRRVARSALRLSLLCALLSACQPQTERSQASELLNTPSLQAIEVIKEGTSPALTGLIAVTDVAFRGGAWGEGRVLIIDPNQRTLMGAYYPLQANPLHLMSVEGGLVSLQAGTLTLGDRPRSAHASVSWHPIDALLEGAQELSWLSDPLGVAYPISARVDPRHPPPDRGSPPALVMSSGVSGAVWSLAPSWLSLRDSDPLSLIPAQSSPYAPADQLSLGTLVSWRGRTLVVDFNTDQLSLLREDGSYARCQPELGRYPGVMEGAQTPRVHGDQLLISFGLSGELVEVDLQGVDWEDEGCEVVRQSYRPALGAVPNELLVDNDQVYVLHSGDQDVWVYDRATRALLTRWQLPDHSHPWSMTKANLQEGERLLITSWLSGDLLSLDPVSGQVERLLSGEALSAPPPRRCVRALELSTGEALALRDTWQELSFPSEDELDEELTRSRAEVSASHLRGAPQLALSLSGGSARLALEIQRGEEGPWEALGELVTLPVEELQPEGRPPMMREARGVALTGLIQDAVPQGDPCERFEPREDRVRLRLADLTSTEQGREVLKKLRIRAVGEGERALITDAVFRAW